MSCCLLDSNLVKIEKRINAKLRGKTVSFVREKYLRGDVYCHSPVCLHGCITETATRIGHLPTQATHYVIPAFDIICNFLEILELPEIKGIIFVQSALNRVLIDIGKRHYKKALSIIRDPRKECVAFLDELHKDTYIEKENGHGSKEILHCATFRTAVWYHEHLQGKIPIIIVTEDPQVIEKYENQTLGVFVISFRNYLEEFWPDLEQVLDLFDSLQTIAQTASEIKTSGGTSEYSNYLSSEGLHAGLKSGRYFQGQLRVNKNNSGKEAFVSVYWLSSRECGDILIEGMKNRNRAIHSDEVVIDLMPKSEWKSRNQILTNNTKEESVNGEENKKSTKIMPVGRVVGVLQRRWRNYVACLPDEEDYNIANRKLGGRILVIPYDCRIPKIRITTKQAVNFQNKRIVVRIDSWERDSQYPNGHFVRILGEIGDLETEIAAILVEHEISVSSFSKGLLEELPTTTDNSPWKIEESEISKRKDLRKSHLVFSIDPVGCEDVDDTLSVKELPDGGVELGVHIADVTHFVKPLSLTDIEARSRGVTVYLADRRYDMLPPLLSGDLCSLLGQTDRYTVSVMWEFDPHFELRKVWFGRTIICSAYKMFYEAAQDILNGKSLEEMQSTIPELKKFSNTVMVEKFEELKEALIKLTAIGRILKKRRLQSGALELDSLEVQFEFDSSYTHQVETVKSKEHLEVHETVAECMIFANFWVGKKISEVFPHQALLRHHPPPRSEDLEELKLCAAVKGFQILTNSNRSLAVSLDEAVDPKDPIVNKVLRMLATRAMSQARYFSTGSYSLEDFYHYGLGLNRYTHFTSPIRRYADILVHRLLLSAIEEHYNSNKLLSNTDLQELCEHINERNRAAQKAQKISVELFQVLYFQKNALDDTLCIAEGVIYSFCTNGILVYIPKFGVKGPLHLYKKDGQVAVVTNKGVEWMAGHLERSQKAVTVVSPTFTYRQTYQLFDHLTVRIEVQSARAHPATLSFQLIDCKSQISNMERYSEKPCQNSQLVEEVISSIVVKEEKPVEQQVKSQETYKQTSLYSLFQKLKDMSLQPVNISCTSSE
ncbi:DIS3-like exonuclease 1 [Limulus polyphemus]|uniref:DIS3-like exonuclease 1 n=1 Tax=Limulus polyphemus TaxID=6850 RepID=A0ABM1BDX3_LIMPO|nr:DIS3-like exonuclease 1 [Limulus polyphemus]